MTTGQALEALLSLQWGRLLDLAPLELLAFMIFTLLMIAAGITALIWLFVWAWTAILNLQK